MLARHLVSKGHEVTVFTSSTDGDASWEVDLHGIRIYRFDRGGPLDVRGPIRQWLARRSLAKHPAGPSAFVRTLSFFLLPLEFISAPLIRVRSARELIRAPDVIIATGPGWSTFEVGHRLAKNWGCPYLVDYRDPWVVHFPEIALRTTTWYGSGLIGSLKRAWIARLEDRYTRLVNGATAATGPFALNASRSLPQVPVRTIMNGTDPFHQRPPIASGSALTLLHAGRLYHEQDWATVMAVIDELHAAGIGPHDLGVVLLGPTTEVPGLLAEMRKCAERTGLLRIEDRVAPSEVRDRMETTDLVLHLGFRGKKGIIPLKFLEALSGGRPILQFSNERAELESMIESTRTGVIVGSGSALRQFIVDAIASKRKGTPIPSDPDLEAIADHGWSKSMEAWRQFILEVISKEKDPNGQD